MTRQTTALKACGLVVSNAGRREEKKSRAGRQVQGLKRSDSKARKGSERGAASLPEDRTRAAGRLRTHWCCRPATAPATHSAAKDYAATIPGDERKGAWCVVWARSKVLLRSQRCRLRERMSVTRSTHQWEANLRCRREALLCAVWWRGC